MENSTSISDDLTATFFQVEQVQGAKDEINIASAQSMIEAIGARFSRGEGLEHIETFFSIKSLLEGKINPSKPLSPSQLTSAQQNENPSKLPGELILGTCNQFNDGTHPKGTFSSQYPVTCSSTSVAFVSYFLNHGTTALNAVKVDQLIRLGQENFLPLVHERTNNLKELFGELPLDEVLKGNMMAPIDTLPKYENWIGETPRAPDAFFLAPREEMRKDQISHLIRERLLPLAENNPHGRVAGAITINGEILGIGLEKKDNQITITLFDSHGKTQLHGQNQGYVYITKSIDAAATTLLAMMPIETTEIEIEGLSKEEYEMISKDQAKKNEISLWLSLPKPELVPFLEETPSIETLLNNEFNVIENPSSPEEKTAGSCIIS